MPPDPRNSSRRRTPRRWSSVLVGLLFIAGLAACGATPDATPDPSPASASGAATDWVTRTATPLATTDPSADLDDLAPLQRAVGDAEVVGLGESTHGAAEQIALKHRTLRLLVERLGFRTVAWEEDWTVGLHIDRYLRTGDGDVLALVREMSPQWQFVEVADVLRWLRAHNAARPDPREQVGFVGVEYYLTGAPAYDAVEGYVARTAPDRLAELRVLLQGLRPATPDIYAHIEATTSRPDKQPLIRQARQVRDLLDGLPHPPGDRDHALAVHHASHIVSFYEHYALPDADALTYRETQAAANLAWWKDREGGKIAYWAASPHTAAAPQLRIAVPPGPDMRFSSAGAHLRERYGPRYRSIGFTFDHGQVSLGPGEDVAMAPSAPQWFEHSFALVHSAQFVLDLRSPASPPVRDWLEAPLTTRGLPHAGPTSFIDGGAAATWFDVVVHRQDVGPARTI